MNTGSGSHGIDGRPFRRGAWRDLAQFAGEALAAGLVVSLVLALAIFIATTQAPPADSVAAAAGNAGTAAAGQPGTAGR